jgi:hypothetical protein
MMVDGSFGVSSIALFVSLVNGSASAGCADRHLKRVYATDSLHQELLDLQHTLRIDPQLSAIQVLDVAERLAAIVSDVKIDNNLNLT